MIEMLIRDWLWKYCLARTCSNCALKDTENCWKANGEELRNNYNKAQAEVINTFHNFINSRFARKE